MEINAAEVVPEDLAVLVDGDRKEVYIHE